MADITMFDLLSDEETISEDDQQQSLWEYGVNFATGQLTGDIVTGSEAVKVMVWSALNTERYTYEMYSDEYGSELGTLIGSPFTQDATKDKAEWYVRDCLGDNPYIESLDDFQFEFDRDRLTISFLIRTIYGNEVMRIDV